jgi:hypothetical protein
MERRLSYEEKTMPNDTYSDDSMSNGSPEEDVPYYWGQIEHQKW